MGVPDYTMTFPSSPVLENLFKRKAETALKFIIIGGSVGGLSCAYNLQQAGHEVHVLERSTGFQNAIGCLRVPPNMTRLLLHWGLKEKVQEVGFKCPRIEFIHGKTGEWASALVFHEEVMKELQADTYGMHYADLHQMILDITVASGVKVDFGVEVVDVDISEPSVCLADGQRLYANVVIGAEGTESIVRERLVGGREERKIGPFTGYTYTVSVKEMLKDPDLSPLLRDGTWKLWIGPRRCLLTHLVRPDEYGIQVITPDPDAAIGWHTIVQLPLSEMFLDFEIRCQKLLKLGKQAVETQHVIQEQLEDWFDDDGHAVLVGDAVHFMNPGTSHGASLAMEDGAVLGSLFSRLHTGSQEEIIRLLSAYQEIRQARCIELLKSEYEKVHFSVLEDEDPMRVARDAGFALARQQQSLDWENVNEEVLQQAWEEFKTSYAYDAYDAADEWWNDWGLLRERMRAASYASDTKAFIENSLDLTFAQAVVITSVSE